jgi:hypothetical protein
MKMAAVANFCQHLFAGMISTLEGNADKSAFLLHAEDNNCSLLGGNGLDSLSGDSLYS